MGRSSSDSDPPLDYVRNEIVHQQQVDELVPNLKRIDLQCQCTLCHFANNNTFVRVIKWFDFEAFELEERMQEKRVRSKIIEERKSAAKRYEEEAQARLDIARQREIEYRKHQPK